MNKRLISLALIALLLTSSSFAALADTKADADYQRLDNKLAELQQNKRLKAYAYAERLLARHAVEQLPGTRGKEHEHALYIAEKRVKIANLAAQLAATRDESVQLDKQHGQLMLELTQLDVHAAQQALERERLQNLLAAERTSRLEARNKASSKEAEKARRAASKASKLAKLRSQEAAKAKHEAELAEQAIALMRQQLENLTAHSSSKGMEMTLGGSVFAVGAVHLRPEAKQHLDKLVEFVQSKPDKPIAVTGYTDSSGNAAINQSISLKRAQSVAHALIEKGVDSSRISTYGRGDANPVASNKTAQGRAKNRRVVVTLEDK